MGDVGHIGPGLGRHLRQLYPESTLMRLDGRYFPTVGNVS